METFKPIDLLVIHPGAAHGIYGALGDELVAVEPPLWARLIAGYVRDRGFTVKILDAEAEQLSTVQAAQQAVRLRPRLICLAVYGHQPSASTQQMDGAGKTARWIKNAAPEIPIIMVGGHVAALPERTMREEDIDFACYGEGPATVLGLLGCLVGNRVGVGVLDVPDLYYRHGGKITLTKPGPLLDISALHGDAWDLLPMDRYRAHNWQCFGDVERRQPYASIHTSLGCPYRCSFCCINAPFRSNRYRMREPGEVVEEIVHLRETYGVQTFKIVDEMFVLNEAHYTAIAQGLVDSGFSKGFNIWAYARVDTVKAGHLALLRRAGVRWLALGIESADSKVRDGAVKKMKTDDIRGVVEAIQGAGINVIANYIFGLPDDDEASMLATYNMAVDLNTEFANFYSAMAYPGSPLYGQAIKEGWTLPETWRGYSQHNDDCRPLDTKYVPAATVLRMRDHAFNAYFQAPNYLGMIERKFGSATRDHVARMTTYKLNRKLLEDRHVV